MWQAASGFRQLSRLLRSKHARRNWRLLGWWISSNCPASGPRTLPPLALGHALAIGGVILLVVLAGLALPLRSLK